MFVAGMFDHLDKVDIVFPVPGETEIVLHYIVPHNLLNFMFEFQATGPCKS